MPPYNLFNQVRKACKQVADQAAHVRINYNSIAAYASAASLNHVLTPQLDPVYHYLDRNKDTLSFILTLDTINFGSGYFPHLRKRPGISGYFTIASALNDFYQKQGPLSVEQLAAITIDQCIQIFGQDPGNRTIRELMRHFTAALNDLGRYLLKEFNGSFIHLVEAAKSSAARLVQLLKKMPYFNDIEFYNNFEVPFFKRAQIAVADLSIAFRDRGWGHFNDLNHLTIFADNLVPHVLRVDGILIYEKSLAARINAGKLITAGSSEEVEIRACAVHAVELMKEAVCKSGTVVTSPQLDYFLWNRGQQSHYKAIPRHRTRTVFY